MKRPALLSIGKRAALLALVAAAYPYSAATASTITRTTAYSYYTAVSTSDPDYKLGLGGLVKSVTREPGNASLCVTTTYSYDTYRNPSSAKTSNCDGAAGIAVFQTSQESATYTGATSQTLSGTSTAVTVADGIFPSASSISDAAQTSPKSLGGTISYDPRYGVRLSETAPDGTIASQELDGFGRVTKQTRPDGTSIVALYCVLSSSGLDTTSNSSGCGALTYAAGEAPADAVIVIQREPHDTSDAKMGAFERTYIDRQGRAIRVATESFDGPSQPSGAGKIVVKDTVYNDEGAVIATTQPYFLSSKSSTASGGSDFGGTRVDYDPLGRPLTVYVADAKGSRASVSFAGIGTRQAAVTSYSYVGLSTTVTDDLGHQRTEEHSALGQVVRITDNSGAQTARQYDAFGNLVKTKDALQNVVSMSYDSWGRRLSLVDPDLGTIGYCYDAADQLRAQQDSKMRGSSSLGACPSDVGGASTTATKVTAWTTFAYDYVGRMTERMEQDYASIWSYDGCTNGKGKLCETSTTNGMDRTYAYDAKGRITSSKTAITNGPTWAMAADYDATTGRLAHEIWPTGLKAAYSYTTQGYLSTLSLNTTPKLNGTDTATTLWTQGKQNAWGASESESLGNGITAQASFDALRGRPLALWAGPSADPKNALDQTYGWDALGRMSARADNNGDGNTGAVSETFGYDDINRLNTYTVSAPRVPNLARTVTLQYNAIGNLLYKSDVGNYVYPASGAANPHAVKSVNGVTYTYDNGNLTTASSGRYANLTYTTFNQPLTATGYGATYGWQYDDAHQRLIETHATSQGTRTTWYAHPDGEGDLGFEYVKEADGSYANRHYLSVGDETIVLISSGTLPSLGTASAPTALASINLSKIEYWHTDALGSVASTTDQNHNVTARYAYDPFGKRRYTNGNYDAYGNLVIDWVDTASAGTGRGFTAHEQLDDIGIVNMNGRIYDPQMGRFMQADPYVPHPGDLQSFNRYSYCRNNPVSCVDPSGYMDELSDLQLLNIGNAASLQQITNPALFPYSYSLSWWTYGMDSNGYISLTGGGQDLIKDQNQVLLTSIALTPTPPTLPASWAAAVNQGVGAKPGGLADSGSWSVAISGTSGTASGGDVARATSPKHPGDYGYIPGARDALPRSTMDLAIDAIGVADGAAGIRSLFRWGVERWLTRAAARESVEIGNAGNAGVDLATSRGTWGGLPATPAAQGFAEKLVRPGDMVPLPRGAMNLQDLGSLASSEGAEFAVVRLDGDRYIIRGTTNTTTIPPDATLIGHVHPGEGFMGLSPSVEDMDALGLLGQGRSVLFNESGSWRTFGPNGPSSSVFMPKPTPGN